MALGFASQIKHAVHDRFFRAVHGNRLIYNTCWEDPRLDREMLQIGPGARVVMITSAGCNALDYLLDDPASIDCVDLNPRQNALLELKLALIRRGDHEDLFAMFGDGSHGNFRGLYQSLRADLPAFAAAFWDRHIDYFDPRRWKHSFYYRGTAGDVAWLIRQVLKLSGKRLRKQLEALMDASDLAEQQALYAEIEPRFWNVLTRALVRQPAVLAMLGVPRPQIALIRDQYPGGVSAYVADKLRHMATQVPMRDNYFWRVYLSGRYTRGCCPNYLRPEHFQTLRDRVARVRTHTASLTEHLRRAAEPYSHFVLLDHQDWLAAHDRQGLDEEWRAILDVSQPGARVLMRSAGMRIDFLPNFALHGLQLLDDLAASTERRDRVGTYGSVLIAGVPS